MTGDYEYIDRQGKDTFCQKRNVRWLRQFEQSQPIDLVFEKRLSQMTVYLMDQTSVKRPALEALLAPQKASAQPDKYVLIIDEFNRANISRVLGELITLLEIDKRIGEPEALTARLPYSGKPFGVPNNLYIIGTMNTADRSIALMDTALRRRFDFREMEPDYKVLGESGAGRVPFGDGNHIELPFVLMALNDRLEFLLGRDQRIGHSYLTVVRTLAELNQRFVRQILPLLQEYFYEDWSGIAKVLSVPNDVAPFVSKAAVQAAEAFGAGPMQDLAFVDNQDRYVLAKVLTGDMYQGLYRGREAAFQNRLDAA